MRAALSLLFLLAATLPAAAGCGESEDACQVPLGQYDIATPDGPGPYPAVIFLHGYGSTGAGSIRMGGPMLKRGYAVIGPQGLRRGGADGPTSWNFHPERPQSRNENAFLHEVIADATKSHRIDPDRILLAGFSIGGSMTTYLACDDPGLARAYAPIAGGFWRPHPSLDACAGPVDLFHTHGWDDGTVPLEGRPLGGGAIVQGDIFYTLQIWRETNGCANLQPDRKEVGDPYWRRSWTSCAEGSLEFALHPGGHGIPKGWADMALDWFETLEDRPAN